MSKDQPFSSSFYQRTTPRLFKYPYTQTLIRDLLSAVHDLYNKRERDTLNSKIRLFEKYISAASSHYNNASYQKKQKDYLTALDYANSCSQSLTLAFNELREIKNKSPLALSQTKKSCFDDLLNQLKALYNLNEQLSNSINRPIPPKTFTK